MVRQWCRRPFRSGRFPHPRGDGPAASLPDQPQPGFSPPAWGWSVAEQQAREQPHVFPTRVGMVRSGQWVFLTSSRFPHPRGDGPLLMPQDLVEVEFSPPAWGWSVFILQHTTRMLVFPTRVGMVRFDDRIVAGRWRFPHPRGDGPNMSKERKDKPAFSPPAWGWSAAWHWELPGETVFPTRVGMVRFSIISASFPVRFPHPRGDGP